MISARGHAEMMACRGSAEGDSLVLLEALCGDSTENRGHA